MLFRSELDALPIQEINDLPYVHLRVGTNADNDGANFTILLDWLAFYPKRFQSGRVVCFFSSVKKTEGQQLYSTMSVLDNQPIMPLSFTIYPAILLNEIVVRKMFTAAVKSIIIKLFSKRPTLPNWNTAGKPSFLPLQILKHPTSSPTTTLTALILPS
ncbi:MAG: hypothetical protein R2788_22630 [Saprospiraceae bacterium]